MGGGLLCHTTAVNNLWFCSGVVETTVESGCGFEDVTTLMEWNSEGVASLPGSDIKFTINEFGMLEMVDLNRVSRK